VIVLVIRDHPCPTSTDTNTFFSEHEPPSRSTLSQAVDIVLPTASRKALIHAEGLELIGAQVTRFAVEQRQVKKLTEPSKT